MAYNFSCSLKTNDIQVRNTLVGWLMSNVPIEYLSKSFRFDTDNEGYHTLNCVLDFEDETLRDGIFDYVCGYQTANESVVGTISKHTCNHDIGEGCIDMVSVGGDGDVL